MRVLEEDEYSIIKESFLEYKDTLSLSDSDIESGLVINTLKGGSSNLNYHIICPKQSKSFFLKRQTIEPISKNYANNLEREYTVSKYLSHPSIDLSPKPYFLDTNRKILVTEFIEGYQPRISDRNISSIIKKIGIALINFKNFPHKLVEFLNTGTRICPHDFFHKTIQPSIFQLVTNSLAEGSSSFVQFLEEIQLILHNRLEYEPKSDCEIHWEKIKADPENSPYGLIHNDLAFRNIIVRPNQHLCFIDFEFADFGDIAYDLAYMISENQLLPSQTQLLLQNCGFNKRILDRTNRYIKIFLPLLELANAHWTLRHISNILSGEPTIKLFQYPSTIASNLNYVRWKIRRLSSILNLKSPLHNEDQIFFEIQNALKIFEAQLSLTSV